MNFKSNESQPFSVEVTQNTIFQYFKSAENFYICEEYNYWSP